MLRILNAKLTDYVNLLLIKYPLVIFSNSKFLPDRSLSGLFARLGILRYCQHHSEEDLRSEVRDKTVLVSCRLQIHVERKKYILFFHKYFSN